MEVVWGLAKPINLTSKFMKIIICSFYSPPGTNRNPKLADYIVSTLHLLYTENPDSGIILGADINSMNISPILNCGLKRQIVDQKTHDVRSATLSAEQFEKYLIDQVDLHCPKKSLKLSNKDKPFITSDLKRLDRKRNLEYLKKGKTVKYYDLKTQFEKLYKSEAKKYIERNLENLGQCKPGQAFKVLKHLGAQPGDLIDNSTFTLPEHEDLSVEESAERIADNFSSISSTFAPLSVSDLSNGVQEKLKDPGRAPNLSEYDVYIKIRKAKKPRSGTPFDIPKELISEFAPELAAPLANIFNNTYGRIQCYVIKC